MKPRARKPIHYKWWGRTLGTWKRVPPRSTRKHAYDAHVNSCVTACGRGGHYRTPKAELGTENMRRVTTRLEAVTCQECLWVLRQFIAGRYTLTASDEIAVQEAVEGRLTAAGLAKLVGV